MALLTAFARWTKAAQQKMRGEDTRGTATIDRIPDGFDIAQTWEEEWQRHIFDAAMERLKKKVDSKHFQIFDCLAVKHWPAAKVASNLGVGIAQVYLVKHRLSAQLKKEVAILEKQR
jgi:RNA polymerase sigma-70 factor (ECF subfamily)